MNKFCVFFELGYTMLMNGKKVSFVLNDDIKFYFGACHLNRYNYYSLCVCV